MGGGSPGLPRRSLRRLPSLPRARIRARRLAAWMEARPDLAPMSRLMLCDAVLRVATAADPDADWSAERRLRRRLRREAHGAHGDRKLGRVPSTAVLLDAALDLAGAQAEAAATDLQALQRRRDGAMLAVLALMPMRLRAFVELRLGRSVLVEAEHIRIALSADMTKTGVPWEAEVPEAAAAPLRRYLEEVRPALVVRGGRPDEDRLWLGDRGRPYKRGHLSQRIQSVTERLLGVRVPPQFFRDAAATTLARTSPEAARLTRGLLGHAGFRTAERHYNQARALEAGRDYADVLTQLKENGR